jgi:hypothetical protein
MMPFILILGLTQEVQGKSAVAADKSQIVSFHSVRLGPSSSRYDVVVVNQPHGSSTYRWIDVYRRINGKKVLLTRYKTFESDDDNPQFGNFPDGKGVLKLDGFWNNIDGKFGIGILLFDSKTLQPALAFWDAGNTSASFRSLTRGYIVVSKEPNPEDENKLGDERPMNRKLVYNATSKKLVAGKPTKEPLDPPETEVLSGHRGKHRYRVEVVTHGFSMKRHHSIGHSSDGQVISIDGKWPYGDDGFLPRVEILSFRVWLDDKEIRIPRKRWQSFYEFTLSSATARRLSADGTHLHFDTPESDGAGSYVVIWDIYRNGRYKVDTPDPEEYFSTHP